MSASLEGANVKRPDLGDHDEHLSVVQYEPGRAVEGEPDAIKQERIATPLRQHLAYLNRGCDEGRVVIAGPWSDAVFAGFALVRGSASVVAQFVADDPAVQAGVLSPSIRAWTPLVGIARLKRTPE